MNVETLSTTSPRPSVSPPKSDIYRGPSIDDDLHPLLAPPGSKRPVVQWTFSAVKMVRFISLAISFANCFCLNHRSLRKGVAVFITVWVALLMAWNFVHLFNLSKFGKGGKIEIRLGLFLCTFGRADDDNDLPKIPKKKHFVSLVDAAFSGVFTICTIMAFTSHRGWWYSNADAARGLTLTLTILQAIIALLGLFTLGRLATLCLYKAEKEERPTPMIVGSYTDRVPERHADEGAVMV